MIGIRIEDELDEVLSGGSSRGHIFQLEGEPGTDETNLGFSLLLTLLRL
jgi:KaiC/GvpD/RAD55 family RecA-like ATPase